MKIYRDLEQGTPEWHRVKAGVISGSRVKGLFTEAGKPRTGQTPWTLYRDLVAETLIGGPVDELSGGWIDRGKELEAEARAWLSMHLEADIEEVGFIASDDGSCGISPDGIIAEAVGVELKCPALKTHIGYLLEPEQLDAQYGLQCQLGLYVTGWPLWYLALYCPGQMGLVREIRPDAELHERFAKVIPPFAKRVREAAERLRVEQFGDMDDPNARAAAIVSG